MPSKWRKVYVVATTADEARKFAQHGGFNRIKDARQLWRDRSLREACQVYTVKLPK